jgi:hypothetical protein
VDGDIHEQVLGLARAAGEREAHRHATADGDARRIEVDASRRTDAFFP